MVGKTLVRGSTWGNSANVLALSLPLIIVIPVGIGLGKDDFVLVHGYGRTYEVCVA
jgi:hypothetical protein